MKNAKDNKQSELLDERGGVLNGSQKVTVIQVCLRYTLQFIQLRDPILE